jgi:hypothetical protein
MKNDIRIVPIQKVCVLCGQELRTREASQGIGGRLCDPCIQMIHEQVFRGVEGQPKIVHME